MRVFVMIGRAEWLWLRAWQGGMVFAMAWLVLEGIRLVLVLSYLPPASSASWYEWGQAFWTGGRFDAKWLAIWLLPAWLALVLALSLGIWLARPFRVDMNARCLPLGAQAGLSLVPSPNVICRDVPLSTW